MITTKTCGTCEHFPNDHHCVGCLWDKDKRGNTKWELKKNPIVIERKVLDEIRERIELEKLGYPPSAEYYKAIMKCLQIIDTYKAESEDAE